MVGSSPTNNSTPQSPNAVIMIRPSHFRSNPETFADNSFQLNDNELSAIDIEKRAYQNVSDVADTLSSHGVTVHIFEDFGRQTPDSVFPNNWFTTHADGSVAVFPMYVPNRRLEINSDIIDFLSDNYIVNNIVDYTHFTQQQMYLEGTGSMVFDNTYRIAYAARSQRTNEILFNKFCAEFNYTPCLFDATDDNNIPIYHTNVLMSVATKFVLIALSAIKDATQRSRVVQYFQETNKEVIELSLEQVNNFAGNALELSTPSGNILAMSATAVNTLTDKQINTISKYVKLVPVDVSTVELAGGSVRCMLAGIHLTKTK
ncbi:citrulline utilization hydrolase CtlX [Colwelliaceae bacterium 6471]